MDQRIDPADSPPVHAAAIDPAFVPGPMPARPAAPDVKAAEPEDGAPEAAAIEPDEAALEDGTPDASAADDSSDDGVAESGAPGDDDDSPACEASDRRASVVADRHGVRLRQDDLEVDFDWKEIGAVEYNTSRFGRRLTVTVHMPNRHQYWVEITAVNKERLEEWTTQLDAVLDSHFEE
ncbi:hypothetical protein J0695_19970 [Streptomyces beijiangensis]|uniref:Uncharacterized protein n=1 Tax=Streptomyces beijiangensis TaxID=163361 RepID=A0A939F820_9ACTN|nr:hypothetical protein [Streptomyces beijiangensis]